MHKVHIFNLSYMLEPTQYATHIPGQWTSLFVSKELESMKKKQGKELASVVKSQCTSIEKAAKGKTFKTVEEVII